MSQKLFVRRFNDEGTDRFATIIRQKHDNILEQVVALITNDELTEEVTDSEGQKVEIEVTYHERRLEFAAHLWNYFGNERPLAHLTGDPAVWNWLSAAWMSCLVNGSDLSKEAVLGEQEARWLLTSDVLRYHRHLVSGPFFAFQANHENIERAMCLLSTAVVAPGELVERIAGKRSLSIGSVCHLATCLYFDPRIGTLRKGHTSSPGNPKAFSYYFSQLDVNVDYLGMSVDALLDILPPNFERWVTLAKAERPRTPK